MGTELDGLTTKGNDVYDIIQELQAWGITPAKGLCHAAIYTEEPGMVDSLIRMAKEKLEQVDSTIDRLLSEYRETEGGGS